MKAKAKFAQPSASSNSPKARTGHSVCRCNEYQYVTSGYDEMGPIPDVWAYHDSSGWELLSPDNSKKLLPATSPFPRLEFAASSINEYIYIFGGIQQDEDSVSILNDMWFFDINKKNWMLLTDQAPLSERSSHIAVTINNQNMLIHGGDCMRPLDDLWLFDSISNSFIEILSIGLKPRGRFSHVGAFCENSKTFCIFGGMTVVIEEDGSALPQHLNDLWVIDISNASIAGSIVWRVVELNTIAPSPRDMPAICFIRPGVLLVHGGYGLVEVEEGRTEVSVNDVALEEITPVVADNAMLVDDNVNGDMCDTAVISSQASMEEEDDDERAEVLEGNKDEDEGKGNEEEDKDEEIDITVAYLSDSWLIDLRTCSAQEINLNEESENGTMREAVPHLMCAPKRGSQFLLSESNDVISLFGGFDGNRFFGHCGSASVTFLLVAAAVASRSIGEEGKVEEMHVGALPAYI